VRDVGEECWVHSVGGRRPNSLKLHLHNRIRHAIRYEAWPLVFNIDPHYMPSWGWPHGQF